MAWLWSGKCTSQARLDGKTAVITGCNTGIGKINASDFYQRGCRVIMACRNTDKAETARQDIIQALKDHDKLGTLVVKELDLSSLKSVRKCAQEILDQEQRIDILVNNAGVMMCPKSTTADGFEMQFGTNHLGHFLFTALLLPRIIRTGNARIVNVSSSGHAFGDMNFDDMNWEKTEYSAIKAYGRSKLANILFTKELARRLEGTTVRAYALHPGAVATELGRHIDDTYFKGLSTILKWTVNWLMKSPEQGAQTNIYCSVDEKAGQETGLYYRDCKVVEPKRKACNKEDAKKLWDMSADMVQLGNFDPFKSK